jgi:polar amino acid transport system permease protein
VGQVWRTGLGFTFFQTLFALSCAGPGRALPGCGRLIYLKSNIVIGLYDTCIEFDGGGEDLASDTFKLTEILFASWCLLLLMTSAAALVLHRVENRLKIPGFEHRGI